MSYVGSYMLLFQSMFCKFGPHVSEHIQDQDSCYFKNQDNFKYYYSTTILSTCFSNIEITLSSIFDVSKLSRFLCGTKRIMLKF